MPDLVIERKSGFADRFRAYEVRIDDQPRGQVRQGETLRVAVPPGPHRLRLRIDWCGSPELALAIGPDDTHVECGPNINPLFSVLNLVFKTKSWIWVREV